MNWNRSQLHGRRLRTQTQAYAVEAAQKDLRQSQLVLDDTWIEETYRVERSWEAAEILPEPVLRPETKIEGYQPSRLHGRSSARLLAT